MTWNLTGEFGELQLGARVTTGPRYQGHNYPGRGHVAGPTHTPGCLTLATLGPALSDLGSGLTPAGAPGSPEEGVPGQASSEEGWASISC